MMGKATIALCCELKLAIKLLFFPCCTSLIKLPWTDFMSSIRTIDFVDRVNPNQKIKSYDLTEKLPKGLVGALVSFEKLSDVSHIDINKVKSNTCSFPRGKRYHSVKSQYSAPISSST